MWSISQQIFTEHEVERLMYCCFSSNVLDPYNCLFALCSVWKPEWESRTLSTISVQCSRAFIVQSARWVQTVWVWHCKYRDVYLSWPQTKIKDPDWSSNSRSAVFSSQVCCFCVRIWSTGNKNGACSLLSYFISYHLFFLFSVEESEL